MDDSNPIRRRRRALKLSRRELGALVDLGQSAIGHMERADSGPTGETLTRLAKIFNLAPAALEIELATYRAGIRHQAEQKLQALG